MEIVGLSGKSGVGKDFIGTHYLKTLGYMPFSLSWHFKVWLVGKGEASHREVFTDKPPHVRSLLQQEGTERGRNLYGEKIWCSVMEEWLNVLSENMGINKFYCPDIRFENECEFIKSLGGKVFRIEAPRRVATNKLTPAQRLHISETSLDNYDDFNGYVWNDPINSETVKKQVYDLLGEESEAQGMVFWDTVMDMIGDGYNKIRGKE